MCRLTVPTDVPTVAPTATPEVKFKLDVVQWVQNQAGDNIAVVRDNQGVLWYVWGDDVPRIEQGLSPQYQPVPVNQIWAVTSLMKQATTNRQHSHHFRAMGTDVALWLWNSSEQRAWSALLAAESFFAQTEARLSRFRPDSELSRLNRASRQAVCRIAGAV